MRERIRSIAVSGIAELRKAAGAVQGTASDKLTLDDELAEEGYGGKWDDHGPQWVNREGKKDGFVSTLTRMVSILPEGKPLWRVVPESRDGRG